MNLGPGATGMELLYSGVPSRSLSNVQGVIVDHWKSSIGVEYWAGLLTHHPGEKWETTSTFLMLTGEPLGDSSPVRLISHEVAPENGRKYNLNVNAFVLTDIEMFLLAEAKGVSARGFFHELRPMSIGLTPSLSPRVAVRRNHINEDLAERLMVILTGNSLAKRWLSQNIKSAWHEDNVPGYVIDFRRTA